MMREDAAQLLHAARMEGVGAEEILDLCRRALELEPNASEVFQTAIEGMRAQRQLRFSDDLVRQALERFPSNASILENYATWLELRGSYDVAVTYWQRLARVCPEADPHQLKLARALLYATDLEAAAHLLQGVLHRHGHSQEAFVAHAHALYGEVLLKAGNAAGFAHYVQRIRVNAGFYDIPGIPWWQGESLAGKRIVATHHLGYGDQLLLSSVIGLLEEHGVTVGVTLDNAIASLVQHSLPNTKVFIADRSCTPHQAPGESIMGFVDQLKPDFQTTILHLPLLALAAVGDTKQIFRPYISAPAQAKQYVEPVMDEVTRVARGRKIVAVAWDCIQRNYGYEQGEYVASFSSRRSIPTSYLAALIDDPQIRERFHFVSLHPHTHFEFIKEPLPQNMSTLGTTIGYFTDTAAILDRCHSVLTIDMSMANLACLMRKDTTLMLQHEGEWRFGVYGERSTWLPATRCIRQLIPGEWESVLREAREHLLMSSLNYARV